MKKLLGCLFFFAQGTFANTISIIDATYGENCPGVPSGNVTQDLRSSYCQGSPDDCRYDISHNILGDPAPGCAKDFEVRYSCGDVKAREYVLQEASGKNVVLSCSRTQAHTSGIRVISATYGGNTGSVGSGNVSYHVRQKCNDFHSCRYVIDHNKLGDPAPYRTKNYEVIYDCGDNITRRTQAPAEATGRSVVLSCN